MSHHSRTINESDRRLGALGPLVFKASLAMGVAGLVVSVLLGWLAEDGFGQFYRSYLVAFIMALTICLGGLFFTILQHITRAGWSVVIRRIAEGVASNLMWVWVLFIPVLMGLFAHHLYHHWSDPSHHDEILAHKAAYFFFTQPEGEGAIPWFWLIRAVLFFIIWAALAKFFVGTSVQQDRVGDPALTSRMQWYAPLAMLLFALSQSFAAFDWLMSLEPHWFSTIFPVYFFAASACGFFATLILSTYMLQRSGRMSEVSVEHFQDMGKLLFAFGVVFWAYIAYSQFMLLWYANLPETSGWYITRMVGGWKWVSLFLLVGHFIGPFLILITRHTKRMKGVLAGVAVWMLMMHFVDIYWLAMPTIPADALYAAADYESFAASVTAAQIGYGWHLLDFILPLSLLSLIVAGSTWRLSTCSLIPAQDPRLHESLAFHNM